MYTPTQRGISAEKQHIRERKLRASSALTLVRSHTDGSLRGLPCRRRRRRFSQLSNVHDQSAFLQRFDMGDRTGFCRGDAVQPSLLFRIFRVFRFLSARCSGGLAGGLLVLVSECAVWRQVVADCYAVRVQDIDHAPGRIAKSDKSQIHSKGHDVLGSLHSNAVQGLPLSFELFLIGLCDLIRSDGSVSYSLCIIEQRVGLVHLLNSQTTGQSGLHERRPMSCAGWDVPRARDGGLGPGMMRRCPLGMSFFTTSWYWELKVRA
jgi:hypothetical protein